MILERLLKIMGEKGVKFDEQGRITKISDKAKIMGGDSVCNKCGKHMPVCWDVVCAGCNRTFCYDHALVKDEHWYCMDCYYKEGGTMHIGFTGTRNGMTNNQKKAFELLITSIEANAPDSILHHGDCKGADEEAHKIAWEKTDIIVIIHPPDKDTYRAFCTRNDPREALPEVRPPKPYLERNKDIVAESDLLIAAPDTLQEEIRRGTWATIRESERKTVPCIILAP